MYLEPADDPVFLLYVLVGLLAPVQVEGLQPLTEPGVLVLNLKLVRKHLYHIVSKIFVNATLLTRLASILSAKFEFTKSEN